MISVVPEVTTGTNKFPLVVEVPQDPVSRAGHPPVQVALDGEQVLACINLPFTQVAAPSLTQVPGVALQAGTVTPQL